MPHDVFISHSQHDSDTAAEVCAALEREEIRCWMAPRDIVAGRNWGGAIVQAIGASRLLILVFSSHSNDSPQVLREVERATSRNVTIVPYRIEQVEPSSELEYYLSVTHWLNAFGADRAQSLTALVRTVRQILGRDEARPAPSLEPPSGTRLEPAPDKDPASFRSCPYCAERIRVDARICRFCNRDVAAAGPESGGRSPTSIAPEVNVPPDVARSSQDASPVPLAPAASTVASVTAPPRPRQPAQRASSSRTLAAVIEPAAAALTNLVDVRRPLIGGDATEALWLWVGRLLPIATIATGVVLAKILASGDIVQFSLLQLWAYMPGLFILAGFLCPAAAVALCVGPHWSARRSIVAALVIVALVAPLIRLWQIRQQVLDVGSGGMAAVAPSLAETLVSVPFAWGSAIALAMLILPRQPIQRYRATIIAIAIAAGFCLIFNAMVIRDLVIAAATGSMPEGTGRFGGWFYDLVTGL